MRLRVMACLALVALGSVGCGGDDGGDGSADATSSGQDTPAIWAVGDGGVPERDDDRLGDFLARQRVDLLLYLGDVYESGTAEEWEERYDPAFGDFKEVTKPTPGNHDWRNYSSGYDRYWGSAAVPDGRHYYSFDHRGWHFVSLNSEERIGRGSPQLRWLREDLAGRRGDCTIAFLHRPRYSAGLHPDSRRLEPMWRALRGRAVAVLSGHDHNYQRFRPVNGIVQFVVGSGGRHRYDVDESDPRLDAENDDRFGALRLRIAGQAAHYAFVATGGETLDAGLLSCNPGS
jgi:predicted phosphodiesterase